jgi:hypothetical protein
MFLDIYDKRNARKLLEPLGTLAAGFIFPFCFWKNNNNSPDLNPRDCYLRLMISGEDSLA